MENIVLKYLANKKWHEGNTFLKIYGFVQNTYHQCIV